MRTRFLPLLLTGIFTTTPLVCVAQTPPLQTRTLQPQTLVETPNAKKPRDDLAKDIQRVDVSDQLPTGLGNLFSFEPSFHENVAFQILPRYRGQSPQQYFVFRTSEGQYRCWSVQSRLAFFSTFSTLFLLNDALAFTWGFDTTPLDGGLDLIKMDEARGIVQRANKQRLSIKYPKIGSSPSLDRTAYVTGGGPRGETEALTGPGMMPLEGRAIHVYDWTQNNDEQLALNNTIMAPFTWADDNTLLYTMSSDGDAQVAEFIRRDTEKLNAERLKRGEKPVPVPRSLVAPQLSIFRYDAQTQKNDILIQAARCPYLSHDRHWLAYSPERGGLVVAPWPSLAPRQILQPDPDHKNKELGAPGFGPGDDLMWNKDDTALASLHVFVTPTSNDTAQINVWNRETGAAQSLIKLDANTLLTTKPVDSLGVQLQSSDASEWHLLGMDKQRVLVSFAKGVSVVPHPKDTDYFSIQRETQILSVDLQTAEVRRLALFTESPTFSVNGLTLY